MHLSAVLAFAIQVPPMSCRHALRGLAPLLTLLTIGTRADAQNLVLDIRSGGGGPVNSNPTAMIGLGGSVLFAATDEHGIELWISDGGPSGARLLRDIAPGNASGDPLYFVRSGARVYFTAQIPGVGRELWSTDGTPEGTQLALDLRPGISSDPRNLTAFLGDVFFTVDDGVHGNELWRSDGTAAGTMLVKDLVPGAVGSSPTDFEVHNGMLYFVAEVPGAGRELCRSDGTSTGTGLFVDVQPGGGWSRAAGLTSTSGFLFFSADGGTGTGPEPWRSDGTVAGTQLVREIRAGVTGSNPTGFAAVGSRVVFAAEDGLTGVEPWVSDGTAAGTVQLADIAAGTGSSFPELFASVSTGLAMFRARVGGNEPFRTDGTPAGTFQLADINPGFNGSEPADFTPVPGGAVFRALSSAHGVEAWFSDGTTAGTRLVLDLLLGSGSSSPGNFCVLAGEVLFSAYDPQFGVELWKTNAALTNASLVDDIYGQQFNSVPSQFRQAGGRVVFNASDQTDGLWSSDGTAAGTFQIPGISTPRELVSWNGRVYGRAFVSGVSPTALLMTDGTSAGTVGLSLGAGNTNPQSFAVSQGHLFFSATVGNGYEPWVSDGTAAGTFELANLNQGGFDALPAEFTPAGTVTVFRATHWQTGAELYVTDGTSAGTRMLVDLRAGAAASNPNGFAASGGLAWFQAYDQTAGEELFVSDGTVAGTRLVADIRVGAGGSRPTSITPLAGGRVVFVADVPLGRELYVSDGTATGTRLIAEIVPGPTDGAIADVTAAGGVVYFTADDGTHGRELYATEGNVIVLVKDLMPGPASGIVPGTLRGIPGTNYAVFGGAGDAGLQVFVTDGTAANTRQVGKIGPWPGTGAASLAEFSVLGGALWFRCDDGFAGDEPWRVVISGPASVATYGVGCAGSNGQVPAIGALGLPRIGGPLFAVELRQARPSAACVLNVSLQPSNLPISGCHLLVDLPVYALGTQVTDAAGTASTPIPLNADPNLQGLVLYGQYVVLDPGATLLGLASLSDGLQMLLGY